ncbi:MAG: hypothetical protein EPO24_15825 [Bacteroidetes bacterium]|nr:MAG: hypothetical protein EPO24_15825 [Bacteroidota bacterium]
MKDTIKYIAIGVVCFTVIFLFTQVESCNAQTRVSEVGVEKSDDSTFLDVTRQTYREPFLSWGNEMEEFRLPAGVKKRDVKRVLSLKLYDDDAHLTPAPLLQGEGKPSLHKGGTIDVIEMKDGHVWVGKDSPVESVTVTDFEEPIVAFDVRFGLGASFSASGTQDDDGAGRIRVSPAVVVAPQIWFGWLQLPVVTADLHGVGAGAQARVYHDVFLGATYHYGWYGDKRVKLIVDFEF